MRWLWFSCFIIIFDQITKLTALHCLGDASVIVLPVLQFVLAFNSGAAFSFLSHAGGWQNIFFISFSALIIVGLLILLLRKQPYSKVAIACMIGGALGNLIDRLHYGYVIDFIDVHLGGYHWPVFNVADSFITFGAILMMFSCVRGKK